VLISLSGDYIFLFLCVYAISKKDLKPKRKTLFALRFFYLSRGREREEGEKQREEKQRKSNTLNRINSNLPVRVLPGRKSIAFCKQGEITPLLQKAITEIEKRKVKHNTQKIIKI